MTETDYDGIAGDYAEYRARQDSTDWRLGYEPVLEALEPIAGKRILDYGCGAGDFGRILTGRGAAVMLAAAGFRVLDISEPTADADWGAGWEAERSHPPCIIYTAIKAG